MTMLEKNKDGVLFYQFKKFMDYEYINHLFTSRIGWNNDSILNEITELFNLPKENIASVKQVHGKNIKIIDSETDSFKKLSELEADGLITNLPNVLLATYHADCVPVYFFDKTKKIIGLAHAGWKGTFKNISAKMISTMKSIYDSNIEDILVAIGPSIGPCCYEVREDLDKQFISKYNRFQNILVREKNKIFLDLWRVNYLQVKEMGVPKQNIILSNICTSCKVDKLYSYRKEKGTKNRMVAAIYLK